MQTKIYRPDVAIIVLTFNAGKLWPRWIRAVQRQTILAGRYLVIDSESNDHTVPLAAHAGFDVYSVRRQDFNHGGTRQWAAEHCPNAQFLVYLTQDAILQEENSIENLLQHLDTTPNVAIAYGRHVPRNDASLLEKHARYYTYPDQVCVRGRYSFTTLGYRAAFSSDVYAVYRRSALTSIGGFPCQIIVSEDSYICARLLLAGWESVYAADSRVEHSHAFSLLTTFRRYFDVGVFHANEQEIMTAIGKPDAEAGAYVRSLIRFLANKAPWLLPFAALQTLVKLVGFRLGKYYRQLPLALNKRISLQTAYWQQVAVHQVTAIKPTAWRPMNIPKAEVTQSVEMG